MLYPERKPVKASRFSPLHSFFISGAHPLPNSKLLLRLPSRWGSPGVMLPPPLITVCFASAQFFSLLYHCHMGWGGVELLPGQPVDSYQPLGNNPFAQTPTGLDSPHSQNESPRVRKASALLWAGSSCFVCLLQGLVDMCILF